MKTRLAALCALAMVSLGLAPAANAWPSWEDVVDTLASLPGTGIDKDEAEAIKFSVRNPECAGKIVSYTVAQDYSLIGFVGALKTTKFQSIPNLPKMSKAQCKQYKPSAQAYAFIDSQGDKLLGKKTADWARFLLAEQIAAGEAEVDAQIKALPYVGTILTEWDCACDAAFDTNFQTEKLVDQTVGQVIVIATDVYYENYGRALDKLVTAFGPQLACSLAADWSGVSSIPLVNEVAASACNGVAGKLVGWAKDGAVALAEFTGIAGGDHMPPDEYFALYMVDLIGEPNPVQRANVLYQQCYAHFEPSNMAKETAAKACGVLRDRFVSLASGKRAYERWNASLGPIARGFVEPVAYLNALNTDATVNSTRLAALDQCTQRLPTLTDANAQFYASWFKKDTLGHLACSKLFQSLSEFSPNLGNYDVFRINSQWAMLDRVKAELAPFAYYAGFSSTLPIKDRNILYTLPGKSFEVCKAEFNWACAASSKPAGGMERPCCQLVDPASAMAMGFDIFPDRFTSPLPMGSSVTKVTAKGLVAESLATWCRFNPEDPYRIGCGIESARSLCLAQKEYNANWARPTCESNAVGLAKRPCCVLDTAIREDDFEARRVQAFVFGETPPTKASDIVSAGAKPGVTTQVPRNDVVIGTGSRSTVSSNTAKAPHVLDGGCKVGGGGTASALSSSKTDDPRIATCSAAYLPACQKALGAAACQFTSDGFAKGACCEMDSFNSAGAAPERGRPFNPATDRTEASLKRAADAVAASNGACSFAPAPSSGRPTRGVAPVDPYRLICIGDTALANAMALPHRLAACAGVLSPDGWATTPCAELAAPITLPADITPKGLTVDPGSLPRSPVRGG